MEDNIKAIGQLTIEVHDENGNLKDRREINNLVVTVGRNFIASRMIGTTPAVMSHMAIGSGTVAPVAANTTLGTELSRRALTSSTASGATVTYIATFPASSPADDAAITEAGIFNAATAGTLLCRTTFPVINKASVDSLTVNWNVTINAS
jgi:hypothetical protein